MNVRVAKNDFNMGPTFCVQKDKTDAYSSIIIIPSLISIYDIVKISRMIYFYIFILIPTFYIRYFMYMK